MVSRLTIEPTRDGNFTARIGSNYLHSKYSPQVEVERVAERLEVGGHIKAILLINPGLDYLENLLAKSFAVYCIHSYLIPKTQNVNSWTPESNLSLSDFIGRVFQKHSLKELFVYAWPPGVNADPEAASSLQVELKKFIFSLSSYADTTRYFRKSWIRNAVRNVLSKNLHQVSGETSRFDFCASGPSLETALPILGELGGERMIVTSGLEFFSSRQLPYTSVFHADGGFWSLPFFSTPFDKPLFFGLRSRIAKGRQRPSVLVPFSASAFEDFVWSMVYETPLVRISDQGTVSLMALEYLATIHRGPVRIFGFDMASLDLVSHARPHPNQLRDNENAHRLSPWYSRLAKTFFDGEPVPITGPWYSNHQLRIFKDNLPDGIIKNNYWINSPHFESHEARGHKDQEERNGLKYIKLAGLDLKDKRCRAREELLSNLWCEEAANDLLFDNSIDLVNEITKNLEHYDRH